jgi:hypothetical protein
MAVTSWLRAGYGPYHNGENDQTQDVIQYCGADDGLAFRSVGYTEILENTHRDADTGRAKSGSYEYVDQG